MRLIQNYKKVIDYELDVINTSPINDAGITKNVCIATSTNNFYFTKTKELIKSDEYYYPFLATLITRLGTAICKKAKKSSDDKPHQLQKVKKEKLRIQKRRKMIKKKKEKEKIKIKMIKNQMMMMRKIQLTEYQQVLVLLLLMQLMGFEIY